MKEFEEFDNKAVKESKTDAFKKNIAGFIDAFIIIVSFYIFIFVFAGILNLLDFRYTLRLVFIYVFIMFIFYRLITILLLKRTIGMVLLGIEFSKDDRTNLNIKEKFLATIMVYINGVDCYNKK